jgi:haloacetate dehalogenase
MATPTLVLWGAQGVVHTCFEPLNEWQRVASDVQGEPLPCGHYIAEEVPDMLLSRIAPFLRPQQART